MGAFQTSFRGVLIKRSADKIPRHHKCTNTTDAKLPSKTGKFIRYFLQLCVAVLWICCWCRDLEKKGQRF